MPPTLLVKRATCYSAYYGYYTCNNRSGWNSWGRWVLLGLIVAAALAFFFASSGLSRRRVRRGRAPVPGFGWSVPPSYFESQQHYSQQPITAPIPGTGHSYGPPPGAPSPNNSYPSQPAGAYAPPPGAPPMMQQGGSAQSYGVQTGNPWASRAGGAQGSELPAYPEAVATRK
ncbi:hypothetical protein SAICODRAFT_31714 [Saitoella complicata NRRL Y-17804]|nr:uncharacterized protein SAICODRAFT_31714 [Saitoella complicata NRRL Y-17804]ODQ50648.1 hypothetical protein SAICODRAFT_31714 [Saitoella complicata NRRL Y-17804]